MKINIIHSDRQYAEALALTLARCMNALVSIGGEDDADFVLCDEMPEGAAGDASTCWIAVNKFEPVSKVIDSIRAAALCGEDGELPNVKAVALTGMGGAGVSSASLVMARLIARLQGKRVLLLSFGALGGPTEAFLYEALAKGRVDVSLLPADSFGVMGASDQVNAQTFNPLRRLSNSEVLTLLRLIGSSDAYDLIVMDVPLASPHWGMCMRAAETAVCVDAGRNADIVASLYDEEMKGLGRMLRFENKDSGEPDVYGEMGARMRRFVQEVAC